MDLLEELKTLIATIKTGTPTEVKTAQRRVESLWNKACRDDESRLKFSVFLDEARNFDQIPDMEHQAYFINTLKWPLYFSQPETFPAWTELLLSWVVHSEGKIRIAAVKASHYLGVSMISSFDEPCRSLNRQIPPETQELARNYFCIFALRTDQLITKYHEPRFDKYKYISSLPAGVYKSLQQLLHDSLLTCDRFEKIYDDFLARANSRSPLPPRQVGHA
jgi:hypothetical protein